MAKSGGDAMDFISLIAEDALDVIEDSLYAPLRTMTDKERKDNYKQDLQSALALEKEKSKVGKAIKEELRRLERETDRRDQEEKAAYAETLTDKLDAKRRLRELDLEDSIAKRKEARQKKETTETEKRLEKEERSLKNTTEMMEKVVASLKSGLDKTYSQISSAATTYSSYVDKISTRLFGANESFGSISNRISQVFGSSAFFKMSTVFDKVTEAITKGISFNVENRAAMQVISEKVATTFDAFEGSLLRLIKIQQQDSTQARLGMESMLNEFLNREFSDTSYLNSLSKIVSSNLLEGNSLRSTEIATELEYSIQKYLGSFSSVGVSDSLIQSLSQGMGYLSSGDIGALSSNQSLEQLLVASANRGGGTSYGEMLTGQFGQAEVASLFQGFRSLVSDIVNSGVENNVVALNQYAKIFGMTVSDITSVLNISSDTLKSISEEVTGYQSLMQRVADETTFGKLYGRTGGASVGDNLYQNFIQGAGKSIGKTAAGYLSWELAGTMSGLLAGIETGISFAPLGVGTTISLSVGDITKAATVLAGVGTGIASMMQGLGSKFGVDLGALGSDTRTTVQRGSLMSMMEEGTRDSFASYTGDYSEGALYKVSKAESTDAATKVNDEDYIEEKRKTDEYQQKVLDIGDNVKFIVQLLNESGIVVRGQVGSTPNAGFFNEVAEVKLGVATR